ncbi:MAG: ImmA/IrrE family metallo-endopeptidase [Acetobacteraceae bacterium]|nr:ImmA/IrrE family metallo-endopeptidase [Acetobacteraceae bacterium]
MNAIVSAFRPSSGLLTAKRTAAELSEPYSTPPIPLFEIAAEQGASIIFADFGQHSSVVAGFCDFENAKIYVNNDDIWPRKMFTAAHELGHWVLHRRLFEEDPQKYAVLPRHQVGKVNSLEQEANAFAAELLVPRKLLEPVKHAGAVQLASIFGVSRQMMEIRLKNV